MEKDSGMAIPTMFNSSTRILVGRGGSILSSPEEEAHVRDKGKDPDPLVLPAVTVPGMDEPLTEEEPYCESIIAQEEGDESEDFSPKCIDFYLSKTSHITRPFVRGCLGQSEDLSETQDEECAWIPTRCQRRRKRQRKKTDASRDRWSERWREGGGREAQWKDRAKEDMRDRRRRRIPSEPCELVSSSDEGSHTSKEQHRWGPGQWSPSPGMRHHFQPYRLTPPPGFIQHKAPLWESPSLDSLGSLLSHSPETRPSNGFSYGHVQEDFGSSYHSTQAQRGSSSSYHSSGQCHTPSLSGTPDSSRSYSNSDRSSESFTVTSGDSNLRCLCPGFCSNGVSGSSATCSEPRGSTAIFYSSNNGDSDLGCFRAKLARSLSCECVHGTALRTSSSAEDGPSILSCLCGRWRTDQMKDYHTEISSSSLHSSTDTTYTSASSSYTVTRSFESLCSQDRDTHPICGSVGKHSNPSTDSYTSSYVCMDGGKGACLDVGMYSDSRCSSSETVFRSDSSCNTVRRSFESLYINNSDSVYVCMNGRQSSNGSDGSTETAKNSNSSLYSAERSLDLPYLSEREGAVCTCPQVETEGSQTSLEVYPNLYCSETDNGLTSVVTSAATSEVSVCDSTCGCGGTSDSLSTSAVAEWGSVSIDDSERSISGSTPSASNIGNSSESLCQALSDSSPSSPGNAQAREAVDIFTRTLDTEIQLDSPAHLATHLERVLKDLRGVVTQSDRRLVSPFFRELVRETGEDGEREKMSVNEGFLFHPQMLLQPRNLEYREGHQYSLLHHIQNGSYGDVFSAVDLNTGFKCAAKKVPLCSFSWEEVGTWSGLSSPRVLQLFGAVREGPNIVLFMDLKTGSLAQLLRSQATLPEDLALHYHIQVLEALEHLHRRCVLHLDVKVDNVLLSEDGRDCFLCDFGLSEMLDANGQTPKAFRGYGLRGTESHMAPEVAKGDVRGAKADVWSSCCMLLHMLNGCHPWTRYYAHPLCLTIVSEEPPLREVPGSCHSLTVQVFRAGLIKDPRERASASELKERSRDALRAVGGLTSAISSQSSISHQPIGRSGETKSPSGPEILPATSQKAPFPRCDITSCFRDSPQPLVHWLSSWRERAQEEDDNDSEDGESDSDKEGEQEAWSDAQGSREKWEEEESHDEEGSDLESLREKGSDWMEEEEEWEPFHRLQILYGPKRHLHSQHMVTEPAESDEDSIPPRKDLGLDSMFQPAYSPRPHNRAFISEDQRDSSEKESDDWSDDLSSGVFSSYNSQTDRESFNVDWLVSTNQPPSCCIEGLGVDIWIEDFSGESFRIRERPQVKLGHVAMGISDQISERTFSLATLDGKLACPDEEVQESGTWLQCVPAADDCPKWTWRIRDGKLEERR